jgi:hypothetical protein
MVSEKIFITPGQWPIEPGRQTAWTGRRCRCIDNIEGEHVGSLASWIPFATWSDFSVWVSPEGGGKEDSAFFS